MRWAAAIAVLGLAACQDEPATEPAVPVPSLAPQPIGYPDIEANDLHGPNCAYASGQSMAPIVMAFADEAVIKVDGEIRRFTLDPQCKEVRNGTGSRYLAEGQVLDLAVTGEAGPAGSGPARFEGTVRLTDADDRVLYETSGSVQCGGA